jgi:hypothetical protein
MIEVAMLAIQDLQRQVANHAEHIKLLEALSTRLIITTQKLERRIEQLEKRNN